MILHDGRYECSYCREVLDIPLTADPMVTIRARSGEPNVRVVMSENREIHRCEINPLVLRSAAPDSV